jgi:hypothetical protein
MAIHQTTYGAYIATWVMGGTPDNYVQAYPQADIEVDLYMQIPNGFEVKGSSPNDFVLKIHKNIYG